MMKWYLIIALMFGLACDSWAMDGDMGLATEPLTNGSQDYPYLIEDIEDFREFAANPIYHITDLYIKLMCELDLSEEEYFGAVVDDFDGSFDGKGHIINNLKIDASGTSEDFIGLFGYIETNGAVENLGMDAIEIISGQGSFYIGGICGVNEGNIKSCYVDGNVIAGVDAEYIGGMCGYNLNKITNCYSIAAVTGLARAGYIGGLCGICDQGEITNCYSTGAIVGDYGVGGLCGVRFLAVIENCFWDVETSEIMTSAGGWPMTTEQMQTLETYSDPSWVFDETEPYLWFMSVDYPVFNWQSNQCTGDPVGDINHDCMVNNKDLELIMLGWLADCEENCEADLNGDVKVDLRDFAILANNWLLCNYRDARLCQ